MIPLASEQIHPKAALQFLKALGEVYPQYQMKKEAEESLHHHLSRLKKKAKSGASPRAIEKQFRVLQNKVDTFISEENKMTPAPLASISQEVGLIKEQIKANEDLVYKRSMENKNLLDKISMTINELYSKIDQMSYAVNEREMRLRKLEDKLRNEQTKDNQLETIDNQIKKLQEKHSTFVTQGKYKPQDLRHVEERIYALKNKVTLLKKASQIPSH